MSVLLREAIGDSIRRARTERRRTLRDVSRAARVSLGYLSEIERGRKEPSSELLASICGALAVSLPDLLDDAADTLRPAGARRRPAVVDPALRSAVEEALGPVTDADGEDAPADDAAAPAASGSASAPSGASASAEARASATDPTLPPDALAGADDTELDGVLGGVAAGGSARLADRAPVPGTVSLIARLPVVGAGGRSVRVAA